MFSQRTIKFLVIKEKNSNHWTENDLDIPMSVIHLNIISILSP